jgi:hypothetical protein
MDPLSVGRSCYKQRDYEGALKAFTEASFLNFLIHSVVAGSIILVESFYDRESFGKPHAYNREC